MKSVHHLIVCGVPVYLHGRVVFGLILVIFRKLSNRAMDSEKLRIIGGERKTFWSILFG